MIASELFVLSALPALLLAMRPVLILLGFWSVCRALLRTRRGQRASKLLTEATERFARGDDAAAARVNSQVLALDPQCAQALILRGMILSQALRFSEAVEDFDRAVALVPRSTLAIYRRAIAKHCLGDLDGAIADYDRVMALEPGCADSQPGARRMRRNLHRLSANGPRPRHGAN